MAACFAPCTTPSLTREKDQMHKVVSSPAQSRVLTETPSHFANPGPWQSKTPSACRQALFGHHLNISEPDHSHVLIKLLDSVNIVGHTYKLVQQAADSDFEASSVKLRASLLRCFPLAETSLLQESLQKALQDLAQCLRSSHVT